MAIRTNLNINPYFDDFDEDKNFYRILFKPGVAVQGRELTQLQTILQDQISKIGGYLFKEGSRVGGIETSMINVNDKARTIRLQQFYQNSEIDVSQFVGKWVVGATTDVVGQVKFAYPKDDEVVGDPPMIVISLASGKYNSTNNGLFLDDEVLYFHDERTAALNRLTTGVAAKTEITDVYGLTGSIGFSSDELVLDSPSAVLRVGDHVSHPSFTTDFYIVSKQSDTLYRISGLVPEAISSDRFTFRRKNTNPTLIVTVDNGIYFKAGTFVKAQTQSIVPSKYTSFPTGALVLKFYEDIISSNDDESLLDPAVGSSNYFAIGADRLKYELILETIPLEATNIPESDQDYIEVLRFVEGRKLLNDTSLDRTALRKELARRTYLESGNYLVEPFVIDPIRVPANSANVRFAISPGTAFVGGYEVSTVSPTFIKIPKARNTKVIDSFNINTNYGNYLLVESVSAGLFNVQDIGSNSTIELHSVTNPTDSTTRIGYIFPKHIDYESGSGANAIYRLHYLYLEPEIGVPLSWNDFALRYGLTDSTGTIDQTQLTAVQALSAALYESNGLLGNYGPQNTPYYGLFREPDIQGLLYWWEVYKDNGWNIEAIKEFFINAALAGDFDSSRVVTNNKTFLAAANDSPFYDLELTISTEEGLGKGRSLIAVSNKYNPNQAATYASPTFKANISTSSGFATDGSMRIFDQRLDQMVFPLNRNFVKSLTEISTQYKKTFRNVTFTGGQAVLTVGGEESFPFAEGTISSGIARQQLLGVARNGALLPMDTATVTVSSASQSLTIQLADTGFSGLADIIATIDNDNLTPRTKTYENNSAQIINIINPGVQVYLDTADIARVWGIYRAGSNAYVGKFNPATNYINNQIVTYERRAYQANASVNGVIPRGNVAEWRPMVSESSLNYYIDDGQRDNHIQFGSIEWNGVGTTPGNVLVVFDYYEHDGNGPVITTSYQDYDNIPTYRSRTTGEVYSLRDCIDFRPVRTRGETGYWFSDEFISPSPTFLTEARLEHYVGRTDRVYVTNNESKNTGNGQRFWTEINISDRDRSDSTQQLLFTLEVPPYTLNSDHVKITYNRVNRYTMNDIGTVDRRLKFVESKVRRQGIEIQALADIITDDDGIDLFKSGVFIDTFETRAKANILDPQFRAWIDVDRRECRPMMIYNTLDFTYSNENDFMSKGNIITMPGVEVPFLSQRSVTGSLKINPGGVSVDSIVTLNPSSGLGGTTAPACNTALISTIYTGLTIGTFTCDTGGIVGTAGDSTRIGGNFNLNDAGLVNTDDGEADSVGNDGTDSASTAAPGANDEASHDADGNNAVSSDSSAGAQNEASHDADGNNSISNDVASEADAQATDAEADSNTGFGADVGFDDSPGGADAGGGGDGGDKIVCTAMNEHYGFGSYRNRIWLAYSARHLKPEHQIGYHAIFLPLVSYAYQEKKNWKTRIVQKSLEHIARHRTADLRAEMIDGKRDTLGRMYRAVLEPVCYAVGKIKSKNLK